MTASATIQGRVVESPIKLIQDKREFWYAFCNFAVGFSVCIVWASVLSLNNLKLHKTQAVKIMLIYTRENEFFR